MKIFFIALVFSFLLAAALNLAHAEDSTSSSTRKELIKQRVENKRELVAQALDTRQEKIASRTAALKTKLQTFRDKNKASIAARVNDNLAKVNMNRTEAMNRHIDKLLSILSRLETRVDGVTDKDTTNANDAIADAKVAIDSAKQAVASQSAKDYTVTVTSETKIKTDVMAQREMLHTDLKAVHQLIVVARQALAKAISETAQLGGIGNGK